MKNFDVVLLTDSRYVNPKIVNDYIRNVLLEDKLVQRALEKFNLKVHRLSWDDPNFDWSSTQYALFRTTWDYFDKFDEFSAWLKNVSQKTNLINTESIIKWNINKHYLTDLENKGVHCTPTIFIEKGSQKSLAQLHDQISWQETVLKPVISGAARHTYKLNLLNLHLYESIFKELIQKEAFMLQPFQKNIVEKGELSLIVIDGKFTHAILKIAKKGDFRVQDDFGGTVHNYKPSLEEIDFAERAVKACPSKPTYARVDMFTDNDGHLAVSELELIEPELWFRNNPVAANKLAFAIKKLIN
jgi:glutathione synthase/RimK-type ligase-like ATP-grasp enzyme